jgi:hypothetical protein
VPAAGRLAPPVPHNQESVRVRRLARPACRDRDPHRRTDRKSPIGSASPFSHCGGLSSASSRVSIETDGFGRTPNRPSLWRRPSYTQPPPWISSAAQHELHEFGNGLLETRAAISLYGSTHPPLSGVNQKTARAPAARGILSFKFALDVWPAVANRSRRCSGAYRYESHAPRLH